MPKSYPGTVIEVSQLTKGSSKQLFDSIFVAGGVTLSQVCIMTGLEPYLVQNWVKRGFVSSPRKRVYSQSQFARIIIINMLRESLQIDQICELIKITTVSLNDERDDIIKYEVLYHKYVDLISDPDIEIRDETTLTDAADRTAAEFDESLPVSKRQISSILQVMAYAHFASELRKKAGAKFSNLR